MQELNLSLRAGDHRPPPPRTGRFINNRGDWYFQTREGTQMGPFYSQSEAQEAAEEYIQLLKSDSSTTAQINFTSPPCAPTI